jgi:hypothetical protein
MAPKFLANQPQNDITLLIKELIKIRAKTPTTPKGGKQSHTTEPRVGNSSQVTNNTPKSRVETFKVGPCARERPRAKSQELRATNSQEPRAESQEPRAASQELRAKSQEPRA